ncbi:MAG: helix-turn-helix domain-containing protein [Bacteriovoracia bacterium]
MEKELLGTVLPMLVFKKEIFEFVENLVKERLAQWGDKKLMTIDEASSRLNIKVSRLRQAVFRREISYVKLGALVRFREEDLERYIQQNLKTFEG